MNARSNPMQLYYLGHDEQGLYAKDKLVNSFVIYANDKPLLEESSDWVHIEDVTQSDYAYDYSGVKIYKWIVKWYPEYNDTRKERYGEILVKDNQGKELGTIRVSQSPGGVDFIEDFGYTPDFKDCSYSYKGFVMPGLAGTVTIKINPRELPIETKINASWASVSGSGNTYIIKMPYNTGATRQGTLSFRYKEYVEEYTIGQEPLTDSQWEALRNEGIL